jgi:hypothetical protein
MIMAGYSSTPLAKKLGIKEGAKVFAAGAPRDYLEMVAPVPAGVRMVPRIDGETDIIHVFSTAREGLTQALRTFLETMRPDATIWVSWPKKSAKVPTDITEDVIRDVALPMGLVDVKVCAVDDVWSGLKLVVRKENRQAAGSTEGRRGTVTL